MKKTIAVLLTVLLLFSMTGCGMILPFGKAAAYKEAYVQASALMVEMTDPLYGRCSLVLDVWYNAIHQKRSKTTDPYTMKNGRMTDDFNVALNRLYEEKEFSADLNWLYEQQQTLRTLRHDLEEPPRGFEKFNKVLMALVDDHIALTCLLIDLKGSYQDISKEMDDLMERINNNARELASFREEIGRLAA